MVDYFERSNHMDSSRKLIRELRIQGGHAKAFEVRNGQFLQIIDIEGQQVADFLAFNKDDLGEKLSPPHTLTSLLSLKIKVGDKLRSNLRNPMFEVMEDTAGSHDLLIAACDERRYLVDYGVSEHRSCVANFEEALKPYGIKRNMFAGPFNIFQKTKIEPDGKLIQQPCPTKAGDFILLRVLMDVIGAVSACPMDLNPIGGLRITDILVKIYESCQV
jgi:uncharacterized protein YcgI (DUF1989 family)